MTLHRRDLSRLLLLSGAASLPAVRVRAGSETPIAGGILNRAYCPDTSAFIAVNTSSGTGQAIGPKVNEGRLWHDYELNPEPPLATEAGH